MINFLKYDDFLFEANITNVIDKLGTVDDTKINDMDDYINHFISNGAKKFSGGSSAEVLKFKGGVIKIFAPINDPGMTRYLSFCLDNKNNHFVPSISKILKSWAIEEDRWIYAIFMENLGPSNTEFAKDLNLILDRLNNFKLGSSIKDDNQLMSDVKKLVLSHSKPGLEKDIDAIISFLKGGIAKYKYDVDFGPQNWMSRGSQLILIDPFWPTME